MAREKITTKTNPKLYFKWYGMKEKCFNPKRRSYKYCGGLGISICLGWKSYENFYYWALDNGYSSELFLIRKDMTKDFSPSNCEWVDKRELNVNLVHNHYIACPKTGKNQPLTEWAKELKISVGSLFSRLKRGSIERALTPGCLHKKTGKSLKLKTAWSGMKTRCFNINFRDRALYKNITVCDSWLEYSNFEKWAYDNGYQENLLLGRKDTSKDYCPENCYWTTRRGINRNSKNNVKIYYNGEVLCQVEVAKKLEIASSTLHDRLESDVTTSKKLFHKGKIR